MNILFRKTGLTDIQASDFQSNVEQAFQIIASLPFVRGDIYEVTTTGISPQGFNINTGLRQSPQGWIVIDTDVVVNFYRIKGPLDNEGTLTLVADQFGTFKFWVF